MRHLLLAPILLVLVASSSARADDEDPREQVAALQAQLRQEQERHASDVSLLQQELAKVHAMVEFQRVELSRTQQARAAVAAQLSAEQQRHVSDVGLLQQELATAQEQLERARVATARARETQAASKERPRDPSRKEAELQHQLQAALVRADTNEKRARQLMQMAEELVQEVTQARTAVDPTIDVLQDQNASLHAQVKRLQDDLRVEQQRHVKGLELVHGEFAATNERVERDRIRLIHAQQAAAVAQDELQIHKQEVERLRWIYAKGAPKDSVARLLTNIPANHWHGELTSGETMRARVALQVLTVLPDKDPELIHAILVAASRDNGLLDAASRPLWRIGAPAVQRLVAAACGEEQDLRLDRGWVMHVLGRMGPAAKDALPWLEEVATGKGREAAQARQAIERIRVKPRASER